MKIVQINSHYRHLGGAEKYYLELSDLLIRKEHEVAFFSTKSSKNLESPWKKYFVGEVDFQTNKIKDFPRKFSRIIYSMESRRKIGQLLDDFKPDIVHIHNIYYYISPSILGEIKKRRIPIVQTVHDYQLISPNVTLFSNGKINEETKKTKYYKAFIGKTIKGQRGTSFMATMLSYFQEAFKLYQNNVDLFITPSRFMKSKLIEYGFDKNKIIQLNNFVTKTRKTSIRIGEKYILYFGRLNEAKGILFLLDTAKQLPTIKFKVAGNFEDKQIKYKVLGKVRKEKIRNVEFLGFKETKELNKLILQSQFVVVPSLWYENQPYSILETFALGKTVLATKIGGIPEIVHDGKNGLLFEPGNVNQFVQKIRKLWENPVFAKKLGKNAKKLADEGYNPEIHYKKIMAVYNSLTK
jgi:glycosyltransferase involved in cell wall biosynthesis